MLKRIFAICFLAQTLLFSVEPGLGANNASLIMPSADYQRASKIENASGSSSNIKQRLAVLKSQKYSEYAPKYFALLGEQLYNQGYFSDAIDCFETGWTIYKDIDEPTTKMYADVCGGELAEMYARLGRMDELGAFLKANKDRDFIGKGETLVRHAISGYRAMVEQPGISFKCGPYALQSILKAKGNIKRNEILAEVQSPREGFSLDEVKRLSDQVGLDFEVYKREKGAPIVTPCVVHWKMGHFAAVLEKNGSRYRVADPTFGHDLWVTEDALIEESSGYFLIPRDKTPDGYRVADSAMRKSLHGKGNVSTYPTGPTTDEDPQVPQSCPTAKGMPVYSMHVSAASLRLKDTPVFYTPPYGSEMNFSVNYNQRDDFNYVVYGISSFGHQWSSNWTSFVVIDPTWGNQTVEVAVRGGGGVVYDAPTQTGGGTRIYSNANFGDSTLTVFGNSAAERNLPDGSIEIFSQISDQDTNLRLLLLTKVIDPQGLETVINYSGGWISNIVDPSGSITNFCYDETGVGGCIPLVTRISDPYGRTAYFEYDAAGRLESITDILGLETTFQYEGNGCFIEAMLTPYGDYAFEREPYYYGGDPETAYDRYIKATDPLGNEEMVASVNELPNAYTCFPNQFPQSRLNHNAGFVAYRNSFYWDKRAMAQDTISYCSATIYHFLHDVHNAKSRYIEFMKKPLESVVTYSYPGQTSNMYESVGMGSKPDEIAKLLDDNQTQKHTTSYNDKGNITEYIDPAGRRQVITYAANGYDVLGRSVQTAANGTMTSVSKVQYDANHRPTHIWDEAGAETTIVYDTTGWGLPVTVTNAKNETTTYDYSTTGLLERIYQPDPLNYVEFEYGPYDQIISATKYPENYKIEYERDIFDRLIKVTYPDSTSEKYVYDKLDLKAKRDRLGQWTTYAYNANRQRTSETNPAGETVSYSWCGCGALDALTDAEGRVTSYAYDLQGRLESVTLPMTPPKQYEYEELSGRLKTIIDPKGQKRHYTYNIDDTIASFYVDNVAAGTAAVSPVSYTWDPFIKRVSQWSDSYGATILTYNPIQGVTSEHAGAGKLDTWNGPFSYDTLTYDYDILGRVTDSSQGAVAYDSLGRAQTITNMLDTFTYTYQPHSKLLASISSVNGGSTDYAYKTATGDFRLDQIKNYSPSSSLSSQFDYDYDAAGRITEWDQAGTDYWTYNFTGDYKYDPASRVTEWLRTAASGNVSSAKFNWRFDKAGNRLNQQIADSSAVSRLQYSINTKDQITAYASEGALHVSGDLDRPGQILSTGSTKTPTALDGTFSAWVDAPASGAVTVWAEDYSANSISTTVSPTTIGAGSASFTYDANGNMTSDGTRTFYWNALDRLVGVYISWVTDEDEEREVYYGFYYDGLGRRIRITRENPDDHYVLDETWYLWDKLTIAQERETKNGEAYRWHFDQGYLTNFPDEREIYNQRSYFKKDHLGSIRAVYRVVPDEYDDDQYYSYDAYGNFEELEFDAPHPGFQKMFTGHFFHRATGLYLAPYRAYNPQIGRWLSREPLGLDGPNLYHYVFNNPINQADPLGLYSCQQWAGIGSWAGGTALAGACALMGPACLIPAGLLGVGIAGAYLVNHFQNPNWSNIPDMQPAFEPGIPGLSPIGP